jgi:excisionase family DNA binding protein
MAAQLPAPPAAASVLDGEHRVQVPIAEAAQRLGISKWLAYKLAKTGELATNRVGRKLYVPAAALRRYEQGTPGGEVA